MAEKNYQYLHLFLSQNDPENRPKDLHNLEKIPYAILPSIADIHYVIGSNYPGKKENEEFIFHKWERTANIQCHIFFGKEDTFWISPGSESSKTFVNLELLENPRSLKEGDNISFGLPRNFDDSKDCPVFLIKLEQFFEQLAEHQVCTTYNNQDDPVYLGNIPSTLDLLPSIFKYLSIQDLKSCSFVSKTWNHEARKLLEKNGTVTIPFALPYEDPNNSMRIFNYLHRQNSLNTSHLTLGIPQLNAYRYEGFRNVVQKILDDFEKILSSRHNFTSLTIIGFINYPQEYSAFLRILERFGENLLELKFRFTMSGWSEILTSPVILPLSNLKKFSDFAIYGNQKDYNLTAWFASLHSNFRKTLRELTLNNNLGSVYNIQEIVKSSPSSLRRLEFRSSICAWSEEFKCLMKLDAKLETLAISVRVADQEQADDVSNFLERNAKTLTKLQIELHVFCTCKTPLNFAFPAFPKLSEIKLSFSKNVRISFEGGEIDYGKHLPRLRILEIHATHDYSVWDKEQSENNLFEWELPDSVFLSFFPAEMRKVCRTVEKLNIYLLDEKKESFEKEYTRYNLRLLALSEMFPKVAIKSMEWLGLADFRNK